MSFEPCVFASLIEIRREPGVLGSVVPFGDAPLGDDVACGSSGPPF